MHPRVQYVPVYVLAFGAAKSELKILALNILRKELVTQFLFPFLFYVKGIAIVLQAFPLPYKSERNVLYSVNNL